MSERDFLMNELPLFFLSLCAQLGGVLQQGSPTRDSHRDSPQAMLDSKHRMSPGLNDNQSGPSKNCFSYSDTEEVSW